MPIRTLNVAAPDPAEGARWEARALLEAPTPDGPWEAIEASPRLDGPLTSRHAKHQDGWYRVQWHDSRRQSAFSDPVHLGPGEQGATGGGFTYRGR